MSKKNGYECNAFSLEMSGKALGSSKSGLGTLALEVTKKPINGAAPSVNEFSASKSGKKL